MVSVIAQIEPVAPVRAPAVRPGPSRPTPDAAQSVPSAQSAGTPAPAAQPPRPIQITSDQEIHLTVKSDTHEVIATLVDTETNTVIRQIPAEETRRASEVIRAITGQLIDKVV
jgi:FlaG protein